MADVCREARTARVTHGLSQEDVGRAIGMSRSQYSRMERGLVPTLSIITAARMLATVGLDLSIRAFPAGDPMRDAAHATLLERLRTRLHGDLRWQTEAPFSLPGDRRAWDAVISGLDEDGPWRIGVEGETRPRDVQALERRLALKERDGSVDAVILLLADTRHNRGLVRQHPGLRDRFPVPGVPALGRLSAGQRPEGNAIILL